MANSPSDFKHITTIIFDMDGTLIEHTWQLSRICETLFDHFADALTPLTSAEFFDNYWSKSEDTWYMMVDGVLEGYTAAKYAYINTLRALGQNTNLAEPMLNYWIDLVLEEAMPFDDTFEVLKAAHRKYITGILTNGYTHLQQRKIDKYKFDDYVDFTLVSEDAGYHKPDRRVFVEALNLAGSNASPEKTIYVGDNLVADIQGAIGAGLTPIYINAKGNPESPPEGVLKIQRLSELLVLLDL